MAQVFEIPLSGVNQTLAIVLNGVSYIIRLIFCQTTDASACWLLDINDQNDKPIVCGIPLVTGADMLEQYAYLNFGFILYCFTDGNLSANPTFSNLGTTSHLYIQYPPAPPAIALPSLTALNAIVDLNRNPIMDLLGNQETGLA